MTSDPSGSPRADASAATGRPGARILRSLGSGTAGAACLQLLGLASRHALVPRLTALAVARRVGSCRTDPTLVVGRRLGRRTHVSLRLDLRFSGCLELLLASSPLAGDASTLALLVELAKDATLAVDIGANVGLYTYFLAAALPDIRILSVEPMADLASLIADNVRHNGWSSRIAVHQEAVGAAAATATLYVLPGADTEHTLDAGRIAGRDHEPVPVRVVTIDDLLAGSGVPLERVVLKIDVEGHEHATLDGMQRTLHAPGRRPDVIMEFLGRAIHDGMLERVMASAMDVYYIGPAGITRLGTTSDLGPVHMLGYWNFLLTARSPEEVSGIWKRAVGRSLH